MIVRTFSGRRASQNEYELRCFISLLQARNVTRYLEIGARHGDTFHEVMINLPAGSFGVALDLPGGMWGIESSAHALHNAVTNLQGRGYDARLLFGDSHSLGVIQQIFELGPFDAILIDGDHRYAGVKDDWEAYRAPIIALHDIVGYREIERVHGNPVEVPILWEEIRGDYEHEVFIAPGSTMGIGVCFLQ